MRFVGIGRSAERVIDFKKVANSCNVTALGKEREICIQEEVIVGKAPRLEDDPGSKALGRFKPIAHGDVKGMPSDAPILKHGPDQSKVKSTADRGRRGIESPVNIADGFTGFFADMVNVKIPRQVVTNVDTQKFDCRNPFNNLVIHGELHIWQHILLGGNDQ